MAFKVRDLLITVMPEAGSVVFQCEAPTRTCGAVADSATVGSCTSEGCNQGLVRDPGDPAYYRALRSLLEQALSGIRPFTEGRPPQPPTLVELKTTEEWLEGVLSHIRKEREHLQKE